MEVYQVDEKERAEGKKRAVHTTMEQPAIYVCHTGSSDSSSGSYSTNKGSFSARQRDKTYRRSHDWARRVYGDRHGGGVFGDLEAFLTRAREKK